MIVTGRCFQNIQTPSDRTAKRPWVKWRHSFSWGLFPTLLPCNSHFMRNSGMQGSSAGKRPQLKLWRHFTHGCFAVRSEGVWMFWKHLPVTITEFLQQPVIQKNVANCRFYANLMSETSRLLLLCYFPHFKVWKWPALLECPPSWRVGETFRLLLYLSAFRQSETVDSCVYAEFTNCGNMIIVWPLDLLDEETWLLRDRWIYELRKHDGYTRLRKNVNPTDTRC